jgi:plasmid maintenance system killer protein
MKTIKMYQGVFMLTLISIMTTGTIQAQQNGGFFELVGKGTKCYDRKDYVNAGKFLSAAAELSKYKSGGPDGFGAAYNAACSWSLAQDPDKAFRQLSKVANKIFFTPYYDQMIKDSDFRNLYQDPRWQKICDRLKKTKTKFESNLNQNLVKELDSIRKSDQIDRLKALEYEKKYGGQSEEAKGQWKIVEHKDKNDLDKVISIIGKNNWPGIQEIGFEGNQTIFLVIQHADLKTQQTFLPMMQKAVSQGNAMTKDYAYLVDRVALREGKKQIYGSQLVRDSKTGKMLYPAPLSDPETVDVRREKVGLEPMATYLQQNSLEWNIEKYKAMLAEKEKKAKN